MATKKRRMDRILTVIFSVISVIYLSSIALVVLNSFKKDKYISRYPFKIPTGKMFVGLDNYINGIKKTGFFEAFPIDLLQLVGYDCVYLYVCMVYQPCEKCSNLSSIICVCFP